MVFRVVSISEDSSAEPLAESVSLNICPMCVATVLAECETGKDSNLRGIDTAKGRIDAHQEARDQPNDHSALRLNPDDGWGSDDGNLGGERLILARRGRSGRFEIASQGDFEKSEVCANRKREIVFRVGFDEFRKRCA